MHASHIRMLVYNLKFLGTNEYDSNEPNYEPATIIIDNEAVISMATCNKDTIGNRHVAQRYHYIRHGTAFNEHKFEWIGNKHLLADAQQKNKTPITFSALWNLQLVEIDNES